ncbi:tRNA-uridine aminocarboxypropyltransferase 1 [Plasmodiophora brassicae]|nr:hypothetical protein PBRA_001526 [Plasmodiophora brassicae]
MPSPRCALQERSLFEGELDCLLREKCICENECPLSCHANVQLNRGLVTHVVLGCRRRWRHIPNRDADQEVPTVTKWLRTALSRIFPDLPSPSDVDLELMVKHALEYNQIIGRASKPVRRALLAVPYIVGGDDKTNFDTTPELDAALALQRERRFNIWNDALDDEALREKRSKPEDEQAQRRTLMGPFDSLKLSVDVVGLRQVERAPCPKCNHREYLYCPMCMVWALPIGCPLVMPKLSLPFNIAVVAKRSEWAKKCTAVHACVVAPDNVSLVEYPGQMDRIDEMDPTTTLVLYPNKTALDMQSEEALPKLRGLKNLIVVDSTCRGARGIMRDDRLLSLPSVAIKSRHTTFWKFTSHGPEFLGTIEAIWYFLVDTYERIHAEKYDGRYDDLMFLYINQLRRVEEKVANAEKKPKAWCN